MRRDRFWHSINRKKSVFWLVQCLEHKVIDIIIIHCEASTTISQANRRQRSQPHTRNEIFIRNPTFWIGGCYQYKMCCRCHDLTYATCYPHCCDAIDANIHFLFFLFMPSTREMTQAAWRIMAIKIEEDKKPDLMDVFVLLSRVSSLKSTLATEWESLVLGASASASTSKTIIAYWWMIRRAQAQAIHFQSHPALCFWIDGHRFPLSHVHCAVINDNYGVVFGLCCFLFAR